MPTASSRTFATSTPTRASPTRTGAWPKLSARVRIGTAALWGNGAFAVCIRKGRALDLLTMTGMLGQGFLVSLQIFAFTLVGSLPLGMLVAFARMSKFRPLALLARALHLDHARHPADAADVRDLLHAVLRLWHQPDHGQQVVRDHLCLHHQLRRLLRRDLPLRHPVHPARPVRGRRGPRLLPGPDLRAHRVAAGRQAHPACCDATRSSRWSRTRRLLSRSASSRCSPWPSSSSPRR